MRKVKIEELFLMNGRAAKILAYLREKLSHGPERIKYNEVAEALNMSRHCVSYNIGLLLKGGYLTSFDGMLSLAVELPSGFKFNGVG